MEVLKVQIEQKGKDIAESTAYIMKSNSMFRQLFVPEIIDNPNGKEKSLRARIIVQRKKPSEDWKNFETIKQTDLKSGDWLNLDIESTSLEFILNYCNELKRIYEEEGKYEIFNTKRTIILGKNDNKEDVEKLIELLKSNPSTTEVLDKINKSNVTNEDIIKLLDTDKKTIKEIIKGISKNTSNELYDNLYVNAINTDYLKQNLENDDEEFWQELFKSNPRIITSIIPCILNFICSKPYVGGKSIANKGGNYSDFIFNSGPNNISLIEIKTPCTELLKNKEYRSNVYPPSDELAGAVIQLRKQKETFIENYYYLHEQSREQGINYEMYDPKCYLIIGNNDKLSSQQISSFELFRNELKDIEIITFNELIKKLDLITKNLLDN